MSTLESIRSSEDQRFGWHFYSLQTSFAFHACHYQAPNAAKLSMLGLSTKPYLIYRIIISKQNLLCGKISYKVYKV